MSRVLAGLLGLALAATPATAQNAVPCWPVPNGLNHSVLCANGFWSTVTPEGEVHSGNGLSDPSATAQGSGIVVGPSGSISLSGPTVTAPSQVLPTLEPYQAQHYGLPPRQD